MDAKAKRRKEERRIRERSRKQHLIELGDRVLTFDHMPKVESKIVNKNDNLDFIPVMKKVLFSTKNGVGLAAIQLGFDKKVIVMRARGDEKNIKTFINPEILEKSKEVTTAEEGCLSYPGFSDIIERAAAVKVKYIDGKFKEITDWFVGLESRIIQHEIDHFSKEGCKLSALWEEIKKNNPPETSIEV